MKNNLGNFIRSYRADQSLREFAAKCGISHTHLDSIEKGIDPRSGKSVSITVETLKKIAHAMNMTVNELLIYSGEVDGASIKEIKKIDNCDYKLLNSLDEEDIQILKILKGMDKEKKDTILNFIRTFK